MKDYLLLLRGGKPASGKTEAENKKEMQAWGVFMENLSKKGQFAGGLPLVAGGKTVSAKSTVPNAVTSATEGIVGGYLIVKAASVDDATQIAKDCPHLANDGNIEVREIAPMPEM